MGTHDSNKRKGANMPLTNEQKKKYMETNGRFCSYCGKRDIEGQGLQSNEGSCTGTAYQIVKCNVCKKRWINLYELTEVMGLEV